MHNLLRTNNCWCVLLSWMLCVNKFTNGFEYSNHVNDFIRLLTVMNFVDDSPILLFARAAVLGYTSKGNSEVCLNAYPLCPRDPDQLVNYLNNHNGGFFRFFNHQLKQQPQYSPYVKKHFNDTDRTKRYRDVKFPPRAPKFEFATRILNDPIEIEEDENYGKTSKTNVPTRYHKDDKFVFSSSSRPQLDLSHDNNEYNSVHATRVGKKIFFPKDVIKSFTTNVMIFPDRTGTGNLILSGSPSYGLKISFSGDPHKKLKSKIKFSNENQRYSKKIRFPKEEK